MRTILCSKYKKNLPGLDHLPYPNKKGDLIFNTISKQAWGEWQDIQTMLINEHNLNLLDVKNREFINQQMQLFFDSQNYAMPKHYVPVT